MHPGRWKQAGLAGLVVASGVLVSGMLGGPGRAEEGGRIGRLLRLGNNNAPAPRPAAESPRTMALPAPSVADAPPPSTSAGSSRILPQPRVNRPVTESDPILTRVAIGRSDDGSQFGMFLQVFADGTVLDSEGVHRVGSDALRPLVDAIVSADANRLRGHCGSPPTDFIEQVHVVVYDRTLGRLRANAFSYSGNPQGCDASVRQLHAAIEAFQAKIPGRTAAPASSVISSAPASAPAPSDAKPIPLTPLP
jgi:hypothetical protein